MIRKRKVYSTSNILWDLILLTNNDMVKWTRELDPVNGEIFKATLDNFSFIVKKFAETITIINPDATENIEIEFPGTSMGAKQMIERIEDQIRINQNPYLRLLKDKVEDMAEMVENEGEDCENNSLISDYEVGLVKDMLKVFNFMFNEDWTNTKEQLTKLDNILTSEGTFMEPKIELEGYAWTPWIAFLRHYNKLKCEMPDLF